jgi:hypothetical protein
MTTQLTFSEFGQRLRRLICSSLPDAGAAVEQQRPQMEAQFNELALALFQLQFEHNAPYRALCHARNVSPQAVTHWSHIPFVTTTAFKELDLTSLEPEERTTVFHSSGTTGQQPSRHFHSVKSLTLYEASLLGWFQTRALESITRQTSHAPVMVSLTPPAAAVPHSSLVHMFETIRRTLASPESSFTGELDESGAWRVNTQATVTALREAMAAPRPLLVLGTAFNFLHLLDHLAATGATCPLPPDSCVLETGGYKGRSRSLPKSELHSLITQSLGVPSGGILCEYGMSELSSQAYEFKVQSSEFKVQGSDGVFRFPPWARVQIIAPETGEEVPKGETGLIRVCDLANVYSVMAIQTEDLGVRRADGFELIGRAAQAEPRGCSRAAP